ncbi:MAG: hypothetical protein V1723_04545 [Candidatus Uhrbacteria bacterium]
MWCLRYDGIFVHSPITIGGTVDRFTLTLGVAAALLHGAGYLVYNIQTKLGKSNPNTATWGIWVFLATLNAFSYRAMSGDTVIAFQFFTGSVACVLTFLYVLAIGKFAWPKREDWEVFALSALAAIIWYVYRNATYANMIVAVTLALSMIPIFRDVWTNPRVEHPFAWWLWTAAFVVTTVNVVLRGRGQLPNLVLPIGGAVLHGAVAVLARRTWWVRSLGDPVVERTP